MHVRCFYTYILCIKQVYVYEKLLISDKNMRVQLVSFYTIFVIYCNVIWVSVGISAISEKQVMKNRVFISECMFL